MILIANRSVLLRNRMTEVSRNQRLLQIPSNSCMLSTIRFYSDTISSVLQFVKIHTWSPNLSGSTTYNIVVTSGQFVGVANSMMYPIKSFSTHLTRPTINFEQ